MASGEPQISILVCGKTGTGKSTLLNSILGKFCLLSRFKVKSRKDKLLASLVGEEMDEKVVTKTINRGGVKLTLYDSPGLRDCMGKNEVYLDEIYKLCKDVDIVLFCVDVSTARNTEDERETIQLFGKKFNREQQFWKRCILILTKANRIWAPRNFSNGEKHKLYREQYETVIKEFKNALTTIEKTQISKDIINKIPVVAAGYCTPGMSIDDDVDRFIPCIDEKCTECPHDFLPEILVELTSACKIDARESFVKVTKLTERAKIPQAPKPEVDPEVSPELMITFNSEQRKKMSAMVIGGVLGAAHGAIVGAIFGLTAGPVGALIGAKTGAKIGASVGAAVGTTVGYLVADGQIKAEQKDNKKNE